MSTTRLQAKGKTETYDTAGILCVLQSMATYECDMPYNLSGYEVNMFIAPLRRGMIEVTGTQNECSESNTGSVFFVTDIKYKAHYTRNVRQGCYVASRTPKKTGKAQSGYKEE